MSWNIKTPGDFINGPLTVADSATITGAANFNGGALAGYLNGSLMFGSSGNTVNFFGQSSGFAFKESTGANNLLTINTGGFVFGDGAGGTRMTLNSTGLGVGVASPTQKLHVKGVVNFEQVSGGTNGWQVYTYTDGTYRMNYNGAGADELIIDTSGNVGIGVTPSAWNANSKALQLGSIGTVENSNNADFNLGCNYNRTSAGLVFSFGTTKYATAYSQNTANGTHAWLTSTTAGNAGAAASFTQAMTLTAGGELLVGTTASGGQNGFCVLRPLSAGVVATTTETAHNFGALTGTSYATFLYATTTIGSITQNGTTGVLYNITSDYRLKESVAPLSGGLARVNALKPSVYKWKSDGSNGEGFLAHELAEVVPFAVSGEKDAVNEDGSIKSQGIDMSRVVPILVAAIQELTARVQTLETR